ncbi:MAG: signal peptide peptidase SppA [Deltaproteobacteria bacterium]|nr:signal peptide peptidase SppA [Deltaproteobacteria bacterium]
MKSIFRFAGNACVIFWRMINFGRRLVANLLFIGLTIIVFSVFFNLRGKISPPKPAALILEPRGWISDRPAPGDSLQAWLRRELAELQETPLQEIIDVIAGAAADPGIPLLVFRPEHIRRINLSQIETINRALKDFQARNKKVIAVADHFTQKHYLLACQADEIILNPSGGVELEGFSNFRLYAKNALEKLKIDFHLFRAGACKSAFEPFIRDSMSPEDLEASRFWLEDLWKIALELIQTGRPQTSSAALLDYIENYDQHLLLQEGHAARAALAAGLVDHLMTGPEQQHYLAAIVGNDKDRKGEFNHITGEDYSRICRKSFIRPRTFEKIAIISAQGTIMPGHQPNHLIGAENLKRLLREARKDTGIKAIVLRLDSGGGSLTASEIIRAELLELKESGKTIVISMAGLVASGAYWIAADADEIWAEASTLTGSIGVFGAWPSFDRSLDALGLHSDGFGTTATAGQLDPTRPLPPARARALQLSVDQGYRRFLEIVAGGRRLNPQEVMRAAEGRVFSGRQAKELGLIDHLGSLADAVSAAAARVGLSPEDAFYLQAEENGLSFYKDILQQAEIMSLFLRFSANQLRFLLPANSAFGNLQGYADPRNLYADSLLEPKE